MKIGVFAAGDRNNYGDILFPIIFEKYFNEKIDLEIINYGIIKSNLSNFGGLETKSIIESVKDKNDFIIICGGETLGVNWTGAFLTYEKYGNKFFDFIFRVMNKIFGINWNIFFRNIILGNNIPSYKMPYNLSTKMYDNKTKIIYNSVGGSTINLLKDNYKKYLKNILNTAEYISVRDEKTVKNLKEIGVEKINSFPDSAILMSRYFNNEKLEKLLSDIFKKEYIHKINLNNYIVFQIAENYAMNKIEIISEELEKIYKSTNIQILLLPIGKAAFHRDQVPLKKIYNKLKNKINIEYIDTQNIYETMYILANTELYIGTSLHGAITAFSFGRRHVALTSKVSKLREFLKTWSLGDYYIEIGELSQKVQKYLNEDIKNIELKSKLAKDKAIENFENIKKIIKGKTNE